MAPLPNPKPPFPSLISPSLPQCWVCMHSSSVPSYACLSPMYHHQHITNVSPMYHQCLTNVSPMCHQCITNASPTYHQCITNASPMCHQCLTNNVSPMSHQCLTSASPMYITNASPTYHQPDPVYPLSFCNAPTSLNSPRVNNVFCPPT